jgi:CRP-like cAMP-binding protein
MASMVGTANETVIRFITEFKEAGILEQVGKVIYITNEEKLKETANVLRC